MERKFVVIIDQDEDSLGIDKTAIYRAIEVWLDGDNAYYYKIKSIEEIKE